MIDILNVNYNMFGFVGFIVLNIYKKVIYVMFKMIFI